jgi:hypothetical protein
MCEQRCHPHYRNWLDIPHWQHEWFVIPNGLQKQVVWELPHVLIGHSHLSTFSSLNHLILLFSFLLYQFYRATEQATISHNQKSQVKGSTLKTLLSNE